MKAWKMTLLIVAMVLAGLIGKMTAAGADESVEGVSVTVPADIKVVFEEDGSTTVSSIYLENDSLVPVILNHVNIAEFNQWKVVPVNQEILADSKQISVRMDSKELMSGSNAVHYEIAENSRCDFQMQVGRGAWTYQMAPEKALELEFAYQIGTKEFALRFMGNGGMEDTTVYAENGTEVSLPKPKREDYEFAGWKDENGLIHQDTYLMPIGSVMLQAVWRKQTSYAVFTEEDGCFTFVKSADHIQAGQRYDGKTVTSVYTGFEEAEYTKWTQVPWYADGTCLKVNKVVVKDKMKPKSTAFWFYEFKKCMYLDVAKLDTSSVTDMQYTFWFVGQSGDNGPFTIVGLEAWDTSQVVDMYGIFAYTGIYASSYNIGNLGVWDVSKVTNMERMFFAAGMRAENPYVGDLSNWDVGNLRNAKNMFFDFGWKATSASVGNLANWNTENVTNMSGMFSYFGCFAYSMYFGDISGWNVGKVEDMSSMFSHTGEVNVNWLLDCRKWNVSNVTSYGSFCEWVETKVIPPNWVH